MVGGEGGPNPRKRIRSAKGGHSAWLMLLPECLDPQADCFLRGGRNLLRDSQGGPIPYPNAKLGAPPFTIAKEPRPYWLCLAGGGPSSWLQRWGPKELG